MSLEGGLRKHRIVVAREDTVGKPNIDPEFKLFSDVVRSLNWSPDANIQAQRGIGNPDAVGHFAGMESHSVEVTYDLQRPLVDDVAIDGILRDEDNNLPYSHTLVDRESHATGGTAGAGFKTFTVGLGGKISDVGIDGEPDSSEPIPVNLSYEFEKVRSYVINQPDGETKLTIVSSSGEDTGVDITIESEGAEESETLTLDGDTSIETTTEFEDIDAVWLDVETIGDITIEDEDGNEIMTIKGKETYDNVEGDRGVPLLESGTIEEEIGEDFELFLGNEIEKPVDTPYPYDINSTSISVSNNLDTTPRHNTKRYRITETNRDIELSATIIGETASHDKIAEHLQTVEADIVWRMNRTKITVPNAVLTSVGSRSIESGQATMRLDNTFEGKGIEIEEVN